MRMVVYMGMQVFGDTILGYNNGSGFLLHNFKISGDGFGAF